MKYVKKCLLAFLMAALLLCGLCVFSSASPKEDAEEILDEFDGLLPEELRGREDYYDLCGFEALLAEIIYAFNSSLGRVGSFLLLLLGCSALMALSGMMEGNIAPMCRGAVSTLSTLSVFSALFPVIDEVSSALRGLGGFFSSAFPLMISLSVMGGGASTASVQSVGMALVLQLFSALADRLIWLVFACFALGLVSFGGEGAVARIASGVRGAFMKGLGLLTALLGGFCALQTLLSSAADTALIRTAKYSAGGMIPVVGSAVGGLISTLGGALSYAKGVVGAGAIAVILSVSLCPLVVLLLYKLCFFISITFLELCGAKEGTACLGALSGGLDALIAVYSLATVSYLLECVLFIMGGADLS